MTTNCCEGYVVTIGVVCTVIERGCDANQPPPAIASSRIAPSHNHLRRRRVRTGAMLRSILSFESSSEDTGDRYGAVAERRIISCGCRGPDRRKHALLRIAEVGDSKRRCIPAQLPK